jgi:hypothetical protein
MTDTSSTTKWGLIAATALGFVLFAQDLFSKIPYIGPYLIALAKFACIGGLAKLGINAQDSNRS